MSTRSPGELPFSGKVAGGWEEYHTACNNAEFGQLGHLQVNILPYANSLMSAVLVKSLELCPA